MSFVVSCNVEVRGMVCGVWLSGGWREECWIIFRSGGWEGLMNVGG